MRYKNYVEGAGHAEQSGSRNSFFLISQRRNGKNSDETKTFGIIITILIIISPIAAENRYR